MEFDMKSELTSKQLKKMYGGSGKKSLSSSAPKSETITAQIRNDMVVVESNGQKHSLPTHQAFNTLLKEHELTKTDLRRALSELRTLRHAVNQLLRDSVELGNELRNKIDKPDA